MNKSIYELFKESESYKADINSKIESWLSQYKGEPYGNEVEGRSKIVWKLIKKQAETLTANLVKVLLGSSQIVQLEPMTANDVDKKEIDERLLNYFYDHLEDKVDIIKTLVKVAVKEGTVFVKVGWKKIQTKKYINVPDNVNEEQLLANGILKDDKGYYILETIKNRPKLEVLANEDVYTDPLATSFSKSRFIIIRQETSIEELKSNPILDGEKIDRWYEKYTQSKFADNANANDLHDRDLWRVDTEEPPKEIDKKMFLYEYWYKKKDKVKVKYLLFNGSEEYVLAQKEIDCKEFPFVPIQLITNEFSIWGDALASLIEDEQKFITSIVRGVIDNMSMSNNGQKFIKKGALDPVNFNRLMTNHPVVEVNTTASIKDVITDGFFNELPSSVYNMLQIIEQQAEALTGISQNMQGIVGDAAKSPATNFQTIMTQAQIRLNDFILNIQYGFQKIFTKWLKMAMKYMSDDEIYEITGISFAKAKLNKFNELRAKYITPEIENDLELKAQIEQTLVEAVEDMFNKDTVQYDFKFKISPDGTTQMRIMNINMLMQQLGTLAQSGHLPPVVIPSLVSKLSELLGFPEIAKEIKEYKPQPDPMQQKLTELQIMELQAKAMKEQALAENAKARSQNILVKTKKDAIKTNAEIANQVADVKKKQAETVKTMQEAKHLSTQSEKAFAEAMKILNEGLKGDKNDSK